MSLHISRIGGLVAAAGLSSRMGAFKPLLPIGGKPLIQRTVDSLRQCGIRQIVVVAGRQAEALEALLIPQGITVIRNQDYASSQMLDSVKLGLKVLQDSTDGCFFLPGDVPLTSAHTVRLLLEAALEDRCAVAYPMYHGRSHPPYIARRCYDHIQDYQGQTGLKGALAAWADEELLIPVADPGGSMDADFIEDYRQLCRYWAQWPYPDEAVCHDILSWAHTPYHVVRHAQAVAEIAVWIADGLSKAGHRLNRELVQAGALLHDVLRLEPMHALAGAVLLEEMGRCELAAVVREHMNLSAEAASALDERAVVFLADKLVRETELVSLTERYRPALRRFAQGTVAGDDVRRNLQTARVLQERIEAMTGMSLRETT